MALHWTQTAPQQPIEGISRGCHLRKGSLPDRTDSNHERVEHKGVLLITTLTQVHCVFSGTKLAGSANHLGHQLRSAPCPKASNAGDRCALVRSVRSNHHRKLHICAYRGAEGVPERVGRRGIRGHLPGENGMHEVREPWKSQCSYLSDCLLRHQCSYLSDCLLRHQCLRLGDECSGASGGVLTEGTVVIVTYMPHVTRWTSSRIVIEPRVVTLRPRTHTTCSTATGASDGY
jgi:hypothetical protein